MNARRHMRNLLRPLLACAGLWFAVRGPAAESPDPVEQEELRQCRRNLHLVYEAIQAYRRVNKDLPDSLAELAPRFLAENRFLICPAARRQGLTSADATRSGAVGQSTYGYEFGPEPIPKVISGGSSRSMREWKQLQMGLVGSDVPMVRCHTHEHATLNLSFGGSIYETATPDWEEAFANVVDRFDLAHSRRLAACTVMKRIVVPRRDPGAGPAAIDLSDHYNTTLDEVWPGLEPLRPLAGFAPGVTNFIGTGFDVRGAVQLRALRPGLVPYPAGVTNILIGQSGRAIHLLLGTVHPAASGTPVARCVFHFADGRQQRFPLEYGRHLAVSVAPSEARTGSVAGAQAVGTSATEDGRIARLYRCTLTNAFPDQVIDRFDFFAHEGNTGPFLVALSVEPDL